MLSWLRSPLLWLRQLRLLLGRLLPHQCCLNQPCCAGPAGPATLSGSSFPTVVRLQQLLDVALDGAADVAQRQDGEGLQGGAGVGGSAAAQSSRGMCRAMKGAFAHVVSCQVHAMPCHAHDHAGA